MTPLGTTIRRCRFPARSTTIAVITLVMLPIGSLVFMPRLHSTAPVAALARAPPLACTPRGARASPGEMADPGEPADVSVVADASRAGAAGAAAAALVAAVAGAASAGAAPTGTRSSAPARARALKRAGRCMALLSVDTGRWGCRAAPAAGGTGAGHDRSEA